MKGHVAEFANAHGGLVMLGLDENADFAATGLADPAKIAADFGAMCSDDLEPPIRPVVEILPFEGRQVLVAHVPELPVDDLGEEGVSSTRNASLFKLLEDVPLPGETRTVCENRGSGIRAMLDSLRTAGMSPPRFDDKISRFTVAFPNHTLLGPEAIEWISQLGQEGLTDSQCLFLALLHQQDADNAYDNRSYRERTGVDSRIATSELRDLVARGLIGQTGTRRWARYPIRNQDPIFPDTEP